MSASRSAPLSSSTPVHGPRSRAALIRRGPVPHHCCACVRPRGRPRSKDRLHCAIHNCNRGSTRLDGGDEVRNDLGGQRRKVTGSDDDVQLFFGSWGVGPSKSRDHCSEGPSPGHRSLIKGAPTTPATAESPPIRAIGSSPADRRACTTRGAISGALFEPNLLEAPPVSTAPRTWNTQVGKSAGGQDGSNWRRNTAHRCSSSASPIWAAIRSNPCKCSKEPAVGGVFPANEPGSAPTALAERVQSRGGSRRGRPRTLPRRFAPRRQALPNPRDSVDSPPPRPKELRGDHLQDR